MDLIKKLTGKNPSEYEVVAKSLVDNSDIELFSKLVSQDDFLFDFIKNNVSKRIQNACNERNYSNLLKFFEYYSPSYDTMFAKVLYTYSKNSLFSEIKNIYKTGSEQAKAYATKYLALVDPVLLTDILPLIRMSAYSSFEPLSQNSIEILSLIDDVDSKNNALELLNSEDEFTKFAAIKFLVNYQAIEEIDKILDVMKKSTLSENIAAEIPYLISIEELLERNFDDGILVLCNIINAIPDIISVNAICDYNLLNIIKNIPLTSSSAVLLRLMKDKFEELVSNDEYLFDCDKNTKEEIFAINKLLKRFNNHKLESLLYEELYDGSDFVFFALDYVSEIEELETLLDSKNQTLILKILTLLKEKSFLTQKHKELALKTIISEELKNIVYAL
jgi:hypothetical protein